MPDMFLDAIRHGSRVLDVGCGEAGIAGVVEKASGRYVGLDVNLPSLFRAGRNRLLVAGEGGRLPFRAGMFDLVLLRAVLTVLVETSGVLDVLREALRVCRGVLGVQDFLQSWEKPLYADRYLEGESLGMKRGVFPVRQEGGELLYWARHYTPDELHDLVGAAGGRVIESREVPAPTRSGNIIRGITLLASS
jgi:ubiquinone/menaquinone biosynthesis C-methylase UbiE